MTRKPWLNPSFPKWLMCVQNPLRSAPEDGNNDRLGDEGLFIKLLEEAISRPRKRRKVNSTILIAYLAILAIVIWFFVPTYIQLYVERIYPYENSVATYQFLISDPFAQRETMYLNVKLTSIRPSIMSHIPLDAAAELIPAKTNGNKTFIPQNYTLVLSGSNCLNHDKSNNLGDGTCKLMLTLQPTGNYQGHLDSIRYLASGDFPVLLTTNALFNDTVFSSEGTHIVIAPIETYFSNEYSRYAVIIAIFAILIVVFVELYKMTKKEPNLRS